MGLAGQVSFEQAATDRAELLTVSYVAAFPRTVDAYGLGIRLLPVIGEVTVHGLWRCTRLARGFEHEYHFIE